VYSEEFYRLAVQCAWTTIPYIGSFASLPGHARTMRCALNSHRFATVAPSDGEPCAAASAVGATCPIDAPIVVHAFAAVLANVIGLLATLLATIGRCQWRRRRGAQSTITPVSNQIVTERSSTRPSAAVARRVECHSATGGSVSIFCTLAAIRFPESFDRRRDSSICLVDSRLAARTLSVCSRTAASGGGDSALFRVVIGLPTLPR
jgi:hypothetical protein